jgi:preprotein translocase subunit SecA
MQEALRRDFNLELDLKGWLEADPEIEQNLLRARVLEASRSAYQQKVERIGAPIMRHIERDVVLRTLDQHWRDHLAAMDYLRQGIHLRGYAQKDYRFEYKREAFELFSAMLGRVKFDTVSTLAKVEVRTQEQIDREEAERREKLMRALQARHAEAQSLLGAPEPDLPAAPGAGPTLAGGAASPLLAPSAGANPAEAVAPFVRSDRKVGRNEPCPCGSGRKYKHCHGALAGSQ